MFSGKLRADPLYVMQIETWRLLCELNSGRTHLVWAVRVRTVFRESLIHAATPSTHADISWTHTRRNKQHGSVSAAHK